MPGDTPDALPTASNVYKKQGLNSDRNLLSTLKVVLIIKVVLFLESIPSTNDLDKFLQQKNESGCPFFKELQHVRTVCDTQLHQGMQIALIAYRGLNVCTCCDPGQSMIIFNIMIESKEYI